jgi:hypothetical protein
MKFLCLAYGRAEDWQTLTAMEQTEVLAQDDRLRERGDFLAAVQAKVTTVTNWEGKLVTKDQPYSSLSLPPAGFPIIEAADVEEVIRLVANSPCARAKGAIEIRPFWDLEAKQDGAGVG